VKNTIYPCPATESAISLPSLPDAPVMKHTFLPEVFIAVPVRFNPLKQLTAWTGKKLKNSFWRAEV